MEPERLIGIRLFYGRFRIHEASLPLPLQIGLCCSLTFVALAFVTCCLQIDALKTTLKRALKVRCTVQRSNPRNAVGVQHVQIAPSKMQTRTGQKKGAGHPRNHPGLGWLRRCVGGGPLFFWPVFFGFLTVRFARAER